MGRSIVGMLGLLVALTGGGGPATADDGGDRRIADFEGKDYGGWKVQGEAFGKAPARGTLPGQMHVSGFRGKGLVNSFHGGDDSTGTLTSPEFTIERARIRFLIGGGRHPGGVALNLLVDGKVVRTATGSDSERLAPRTWEVGEFLGQTARLEVVDRKKGGWGHILVDQIVQTNRAFREREERHDLLSRAEDSVREAAERVKADPLRPTYHVLAPAQWINDPNGPLYFDGYYHLFYQHNPYGEAWGNMHWGHVRSKDLAHWERQPIALWPSKERGEDHVFSGCATIGEDGRPILFYTSIGGRLPEQWAAIPEDGTLASWKKHPANPILTEEAHGDVKVHEWRDPFLFSEGGRTYMVLGGNLNESKGGRAVVNVYRAEDDGLTKWKYLGVLFTHPDAEVRNIECPNFFRLGEKWVLIVSQGMPVQYFVGSLDADSMRFRAEGRGLLDGGHHYAPNSMEAPDGRRLLWGWVNGYKPGRGWQHCLTIPRVLRVGEDGLLRQEPAAELHALRGVHQKVEPRPIEGGATGLDAVRGEALEIVAEFERGEAEAVGLRVFRSPDGARSVPITFDGQAIDVAGSKAPLALAPGEPLRLHVFLDRSVVEVFANGRASVTRVVFPDRGDDGVQLVAEGGKATLKGLDAWAVGSIWSEAPETP